MDSNLSEMQGEYESLKSEAERKNSVKFQGKNVNGCNYGS